MCWCFCFCLSACTCTISRQILHLRWYLVWCSACCWYLIWQAVNSWHLLFWPAPHLPLKSWSLAHAAVKTDWHVVCKAAECWHGTAGRFCHTRSQTGSPRLKEKNYAVYFWFVFKHAPDAKRLKGHLTSFKPWTGGGGGVGEGGVESQACCAYLILINHTQIRWLCSLMASSVIQQEALRACK